MHRLLKNKMYTKFCDNRPSFDKITGTIKSWKYW